MQSFIEIDKTHYPIVVARYASFEPTDEEFDVYLDNMFQLYSTHKGIVIVFDASKAPHVPWRLRIKLGRWLRDNRELVKSAVWGAAYVTPHMLSQILLEGILMIQRPLWDNTVVLSLDEAFEWANGIIKKNSTDY